MVVLNRAGGNGSAVAWRRLGWAATVYWVLAAGAAGGAFACLLSVFLLVFNTLALGGPPGVVTCLASLLGALAGAGAGMLAGWGQARVLGGRLPGARGWIRATAGGWALAGFLGYYGVLMVVWQVSSPDLLGAALVLGGAAVGGVQGLYLRLDFRRLGGWIGANTLGVGLGWSAARAVWGSIPVMDATGGLLGWTGFLFPATVAGIAGMTTAFALHTLLTHQAGGRVPA